MFAVCEHCYVVLLKYYFGGKVHTSLTTSTLYKDLPFISPRGTKALRFLNNIVIVML